MKKNKLLLPSKILVTVMTFLFGIVLTGGNIAIQNAGAINDAFNIETQIIEDDVDADSADSEYFTSDFNSVAEVRDAGAQFCYDVEAGGATLLKNDNALPLNEGAKVSLFSYSSVDIESRGYGSGAGKNDTEVVDLNTALTDSGLEVNQTLWQWYKNNPKYRRDPGDNAHSKVKILDTMTIGDAPWNEVYSANSSSFSEYRNAAIFVLSRSGGENADMRINSGDKSDMTDGDYLKLSPKEIGVLKGLKSLKGTTFDKIIVLMNTASPVQCEFVDNEEYGIDAVLWIGLVGSNGTRAVGDILTGKVNPSGKLSDTYWKYHYKNPVLANFGLIEYDDNYAHGENDSRYVVYQEGIYNGYRYTETRYEDYVMDTANVGEFDYYDTVSYPFGFGLSYTKFKYSDFSLDVKTANGKVTCKLQVTVTNNGDRPGRETVQFYIQKPYTQHDRDNGIEKASVELVGFGKTGLLEVGQPQVISCTVDGNELLSYDAYSYKTYILEAGKYYFTAARDAHDAINNVLAKKGYSNDKMTEKGDSSLADTHTVAKTDSETYSYSTSSGDRVNITNQFDDADLKLYSGAGDNADGFEYISRSNWAGTVRFGYNASSLSTNAQVSLSRTSQMLEDLKDREPQPDDVEYPTTGSTKTNYNLIALRAFSDGTPIPYDNPMWEDLLDQLTWQDMANLLEVGYRSTGAVGTIAKPGTIDHNGSIGVCQPFSTGSRGLAVQYGDPDMDKSPAIYPCCGIVASTFDIELIEDYGVQWGEECLWAGYNGLYGPSVNLHRGQYCGRSYEYFSEDPFLSGVSCAYLTKGISEKGVYVYLKHCVLNDQETARHGVCTWANEQTVRELYLRPFEIAIEDGGAQCVMTGFNRIGTKWTGTHGFCKSVLRNEFGMSGFAISDNPVKTYMTIPYGVLMGNDLPDYTCLDVFKKYENGYGELANAMRESVHRILYTVVQSNAMNGFTPTTRVILVTPAWVTAIYAGQGVVSALFGLSVAFLGVALFFKYYALYKERKQVS